MLNRNNIRKLFIYGFVFLVLLVGVGLYRMSVNPNLDLIIKNISAPENFVLTVDNIREYVNKNSVNIIDDDFWSYKSDHERVAGMMIDHESGLSTYKPHLECSARASLFKTLLKRMGYKSRVVYVWTHLDEFPSHTFLEVFNNETKKWEVSDADYNLYYEDISTKQRLSVNDLLRLDQSMYHPCGKDTGCGWDIQTKGNDPANNLKKYMALASYSDDDGRITVVNVNRFSLEKPALLKGENRRFCDVFSKFCSARMIEYP